MGQMRHFSRLNRSSMQIRPLRWTIEEIHYPHLYAFAPQEDQFRKGLRKKKEIGVVTKGIYSAVEALPIEQRKCNK